MPLKRAKCLDNFSTNLHAQIPSSCFRVWNILYSCQKKSQTNSSSPITQLSSKESDIFCASILFYQGIKIIVTSISIKMPTRISTWPWGWSVFADYTNVVRMEAVVTSPSAMAALCNACFITDAVHIVQPNLVWCTVSIVPAAAVCTPSTFAEPHHAANDVCFFDSPVVVTYGSPCVVQINFYSSLI